MFCLPQNDQHICFTVTTARQGNGETAILADADSGLPTREAFLAAATQLATEDDALTLVNVSGLNEICAKMDERDASKLLRHVGVSIMEYGSKAAGRLSDESFGIVANALREESQLADRVRKALAEGGVNTPLVGDALISLKGRDLTPDQRMLAIRYVVDRFVNGEQACNSPADIALAFHDMMDETQARVRAITATVADGSFSLAYQPIRHLKTSAISHFEALARFSPTENTGDIVKFSEALGIADALDLAVALKTLAMIESELAKNANIAFNVSGHTISCNASFSLLAGFLARNRAHAPRILIEITETAHIINFAAAAHAVGTLREMGYRVGISEFGVSPVSLKYLHALPVDFVKFPASLMRSSDIPDRNERLVAGILKLCRELGVHTIAEGLENEDALKRARALGFDLGQGHVLGKPADMAAFSRGPRNDNSIRPARRDDVVESYC